LAFYQVDFLPMDAEVIFLSGEWLSVNAIPFEWCFVAA
jgi:hypothetical protein